jgi:hypothetical protein
VEVPAIGTIYGKVIGHQIASVKEHRESVIHILAEMTISNLLKQTVL